VVTNMEIRPIERQFLILVAIGYGLMLADGSEPSSSSVIMANTLVAPLASSASIVSAGDHSKPDVLWQVLLALARSLSLVRCLAKVFAYLSQPPVIGEWWLGFCLGPSSRLKISALILPPAVAPLPRCGGPTWASSLYMFIIGLGLMQSF